MSIRLHGVRWEWDPLKTSANRRAHDVSFAEAATVLEDDQALTREDPDAMAEQRFVTLGLSSFGNLIVVYSYRGPNVVRLISAWKASRRQRSQYAKARG